MSGNKDVPFFRRNGKIIPIRLNKSQKGQLQGAGIAAAGVAVAAAGGRIYKNAVTKSASLGFKGFTRLERLYKASGPQQMNFFDAAKKKKRSAVLRKAAFDSLEAGKKLGSISKSVRLGSVALGAGLIGYGTTKAINSMTKKQKQNLNPELLAGGAAALGAVLPNAYNASVKAFTAGMASNQTSLKFAKKSWITHGPKIKQLVKGIVLK